MNKIEIDKSEKFTEVLDALDELKLEDNIVRLRKEGYTYKQIRLKLGNPSNKKIREVLLKHCPELAGDTEEWKALQKKTYGL